MEPTKLRVCVVGAAGRVEESAIPKILEIVEQQFASDMRLV